MSRLAIVGVFLLTTAGRLAAQVSAPTPEPPKPPLLAPIPARSQWVVRVDPPRSGAPAPTDVHAKQNGLPVYIAVTKVGATMRSLVGMADKTRREYWQVGGTAVLQDGGHLQVVSNTQGFGLYTFASTGAFYGFAWIKPENFRGTEKHRGIDCHHYVEDTPDTRPPSAEHPAPAPPFHREAWINADTRQPVSVAAEFGVLDYEFSEPPPSLSLPPDFQAALDADDAALDKMHKRTHPH